MIAFTGDNYSVPSKRTKLLLSASVLAVGASTTAWAQQFEPCPSAGSNVTCTINSGDDVDGAYIRYWAPSSTDDDENGQGAGVYTLNNHANIPETGEQNNVLYLRLSGGYGYDNGHGDSTDGGAGGAVYINNYADITMEGTATTSDSSFEDGKAPGVWDDVGAVAAIYAVGNAGSGGNSTSDVGGGDGGNGGRSGEGWIKNDGNVTVSMALPNGGAGIYGAILSGDGGTQNSTAGDQDGGNGGGASKELGVDNSGNIDVTSGAAGRYVWGIGVEAIGGKGGASNGNGGEVGAPSVTSTGAVTVTAEGSDGFPFGVRGIYVSSIGGSGYIQSTSDNADNGGYGAVSQHVTTTVSGDVSVTSHSVAKPDDAFDPQVNPATPESAANIAALQQSGGIVLYSRGGDGGAGPLRVGSDDRYGGTGGGASYDYKKGDWGTSYLKVNNHASVTTEGNYLPGIAVLSVGGIGGAGREDSNGNYGGFGGNVGVDLEWGATVSTDGAQSVGIIARSQGGPGGDYHPSSGVIDFTPDAAGNGGNGGSVNVNLGFIVDANNQPTITDAPTIITKGDASSGVIAQSFGAQGGDTGDSFQLLGQTEPSTGYGGSGGTVWVNAHADITTYGRYSRGIIAQSVGNSGGTSGESSGIVVVGGASGAGVGGIGGHVVGDFGANITTTGEAGTAILAQSIGGGGGIGEGADGVNAVGGQGGSGGAGGRVDLTALGGTISTEGDFAYGIVGQSIGGGGGDGGSTFTFGVGTIPATGVGGDGGVAGNGGDVTITNDDSSISFDISKLDALSVTTGGDNAHGVVAQSVGGGGGTGGDANGGGLSLESFQMAGGAKSGGDGGSAKLEFDGASVTTTGSHAIGLVSQSVGGGGGTGGSAYSFDASFGFSLSVGVGGLGGDGGAGGSASVDLTNADVTTGADGVTNAHGIVVQSIGGGGGIGGSSVSKAVTKAVSVPETDVDLGFSAAVAVGGQGGGGGNGGPAAATLMDTGVTTHGDGSMGLIVQSIGGGGGAGGSASSSAGVIGGEDAISASVSAAVGGSGDTGGTGGTADIRITGPGTIETFGDYANAVFAQSIGGGGGSGGVGSASTSHVPDGFHFDANIGVGGTGKGGGNGGNVTVSLGDYSGGPSLQTFGSGARGIVAQSIGGGGGASQGASVSLSAGGELPEEDGSSDGGSAEATVDVSVGRNGGGGGSGGAVNVNFFEDVSISTTGGGADGVLAQSIGGGGGLGGSVASATPDDSESPDDGDTSYTFSVGVGGAGGAAGGGGSVKLDYDHGSMTTTTGDWADGVVLQSIGGGGGVGGSATTSGSEATADISVAVGGQGGAGGDGGDVVAKFNGTGGSEITTHGYMAHGVVLQSIGGGGGQGGDGSDKASGSLTVGGGFGGSGGATGDGGSVSIVPLVPDDANPINSYLVVTTYGNDAIGLLAQSIGGGGGIGGAGNSTAAKSDDNLDISVAVGGSGSVAGDGGPVTLTTQGVITTEGDRAYGLVAQSIGGGGGIGGAGSGAHLSHVSLGGANGASGDGGNVTLNLPSSTITTSGAGAHGIVAQSIGGGGGIVGDASGSAFDTLADYSIGVANAPRDASAGGEVSVMFDGSIVTTGANAYGIIAQSIGGGGGFGGDLSRAFAGSTVSYFAEIDLHSSPVTIKQTGSISASGQNSVGIFAQSMSPTSNGVVTVTVGGPVTGGSGSGKGVWISGGVNNQLTIKDGASVSAASNVAIRYDGYAYTENGSTLTVDNYGTISGDVLLYNADGDHAGTVNNYSDDTLIGASTYAANIMNAGRLVVGHTGAIDGTEITGDFTQTAAGTLATDVDFNRTSADLLSVDGNADLAGTLAVQPLSLRPDRTVTVLSVDGSTTGAIHPQYSPIYDFALARAGHQVNLSVAAAHFNAAALRLHDNQANVADYLQAVWNAGGSDSFGRLFGALGTAADHGAGAYSDMLADLSPGVALAPAAQTQAGVARFNSAMMSCPRFFGTNALTGEGNCYWGQVTSLSADHDSQDGVSGYNTSGMLYQIGRQSEVARGWFVDVSGAYQHSDLDGSEDRVSGDGDTFYAGAALKHEMGPWLVAGALSASYGNFDMQRRLSIPRLTGTPSSDPDVYAGSARVRVARTFASAHAYLKPYVDLDAIYARMPGYRESGNSDIALEVDNSDQFTFAFSPTLELGGRFDGDHGSHLRPYAYAGLTVLSDSDWTATAHFTGTRRDLGGFDMTLPGDDVVARAGFGVEIYSGKGVNVRLQYDGEFSDDLSSNNASLKVMIPFGA